MIADAATIGILICSEASMTLGYAHDALSRPVSRNADTFANADTAGNVVAEYAYDAFGRTISRSGTMSDVFRHRFSTKYCDTETGLYYYGCRCCSHKHGNGNGLLSSFGGPSSDLQRKTMARFVDFD